MNNIKTFIRYILVCFSAVMLNACSSDFVEEADGDYCRKETSCRLVLDAVRPSFSDDLSTRAADGRWEDGDKVYIYISSTVNGVGIYKNGDWEITYRGKLSNISGAPCSIYYMKGNCESTDNQLFTMDETTVVYGTTSGIYSYHTGELNVSATLKPLTSRLRFMGSANTQLVLTPSAALKHYCRFDLSKNQFNSATGNTVLTVNSDGYSDYIYVMAEEDVSLSLKIKRTIYSDKQLSSALFSAGASGCIDIPSSDFYDGWVKTEVPKAIMVDGIAFNKTIKQLSGDSNPDSGTENTKIKQIVFDYNSSLSTGVLVSTADSKIPIYANYIDGIITISTPDSEIFLTDMRSMFAFCSSLKNIDLSGVDTQEVTNMGRLFADCGLTNLDLSGINTQNVTFMDSLFCGCRNLKSIDLTGFNTHNVKDMRSMFENCSSLTSLDVSGFDTQNVTNMAYMFKGCWYLTSLDVSGFDTQNVTNMAYMFGFCSKITSLDVSGFNTQNVTNMAAMFYDCERLESLDVSGFDTQNVMNMYEMFDRCFSLASLDVSGFDTQNVTNMVNMFSSCGSLTSLDVSGFDTQNVTYMANMFSSCVSLTSLDLGRDFVLCAEVSRMCYSLAQDSGHCTIKCTEATKNGLCAESTELDTSIITWSIYN